MRPEPVLYAVRDGVATVTLNRPEARNALNAELVAALDKALARAAADQAVRVIVLTGAGEQAFCAGGDLSDFAEITGVVARQEATSGFARLLRRFADLPKPVVAAVNGHALGGGFGLVLACDLAVAVEHARLGTPEVRVGLFPMMVMALLARHVGPKRAFELMFTGTPIPAPHAERLGLINRAVPAEALWEAVAELTGHVAAFSPTALRLGRRAFYAAAEMSREHALEYLHQMLVVLLSTEDAQEGIQAFLEKREPVWTGQ
ncbi:MAG: enoyl-CoA hydratase-related protein [Ardenticatenia bacterium]|nr:enoyl-CoA hydratase-related protein [Ardenticatenia bacterium]